MEVGSGPEALTYRRGTFMPEVVEDSHFHLSLTEVLANYLSFLKIICCTTGIVMPEGLERWMEDYFGSSRRVPDIRELGEL